MLTDQWSNGKCLSAVADPNGIRAGLAEALVK